MCWDYDFFFRFKIKTFNMTVHILCVCYMCCFSYHVIIMDLESVNKHLL